MSRPQGPSASSSSTAIFTDDHKLRVNISNRDLLCVNGCGFYGTPQWENRCSKCWRLHQTESKKNEDYMKNKLAFRQFEERRKLSTESRTLTIKNLLKKSPSLVSSHPSYGDSSMHSSASAGRIHEQRSTAGGANGEGGARTRHRSPDSQLARDELTDFISRSLPASIATAISKSLSQLTSNIYEPVYSPEDLSAHVQAYYTQLEAYLNSHQAFTLNKVDVRVQDVMEAIEGYLCGACYGRLFWADSDEEVADISLQERIRSLQWVTFGFLETKLDLTKEEARDRLDEAINEIIGINSHRRVDEKLDCLLRCSHKIFDSLRESGSPTSADEFLPALIYVLLKGNPPLIQSNVRFISRFALPSRVMSGEPAYFFTNVSGALQFVMDINHDSLKMSREEFEDYTSGAAAPPLNKAVCGCNQALSSLSSSLARMNRLLEEQQAMEKRIEEFGKTTSEEESSLSSKINHLSMSFPTTGWIERRERVSAAETAATDACKQPISEDGVKASPAATDTELPQQ